jgi:GT2 family glycosyltransferase
MNSRTNQVAVILVNYNSSQYTLDCIKSIQEKTSGNLRYQVIVVDNNSKWDEFLKLGPLHGQSGVTIFRSKINMGFSGANMAGVQLADAEYYYFLNNDCLLLNDVLSILLGFMEVNPAVANCSGEMFLASMEYEYNFRYFPTLLMKLVGSGLLRKLSPDLYPDKHTRLTKPTRVDLVNGSSMFIRAVPFEEIGGFDTNYFLYLEEEDIALRLSRAGHETYLVPDARYQHFISKSTTSDEAINLPFLKEFYISLFYFYTKNYGRWYRYFFQVLYFFKTLRKFYKSSGYIKLAFFIGGGASVSESIRFRQKMSPR